MDNLKDLISHNIFSTHSSPMRAITVPQHKRISSLKRG